MNLLIVLTVLAANATQVNWTRKVYSEARRDQRALMIVIDEPSDPGYLPQVVERRSYTDKAQLERAKQNVKTVRAAFRPLTITNNPIWPIDHGWTEQDEQDYSAWIHQIADPGFLVGGGVDVDCADYAMALRWIYSHDHHLPAGDTTISGPLFGSWQSTTTWDALPTDADWKKDERFKASLRYILANSYTHSLLGDLYPVAINPDYVNPGTIFLTLSNETGHTRTIYNIGQSDVCDDPSASCIAIIWGNEPSSEQGWETSFVPQRVESTEGGFLRFRWPELTPAGWILRAPADMRGYSSEQYDWDSGNYLLNVANGLGLWNSPEERYTVVGGGVINLLNMRMQITEHGFMMCYLIPCSPADPAYSEFSTPNRDRTLVAAIKNFQTVAAQTNPNNWQVQSFIQENSRALFKGSGYTVMDILQGQIASGYISDPTQDFFIRWAVNAPSDENKLWVAYRILLSNSHWRDELVDKAHELCFPGGATAPLCDPLSTAVKRLSTDRLDQAFRLMQTNFTAAYNAAPAQLRSQIDDYLKESETHAYYCGPGGDEMCSLYDFVFGTHWAAMTSNADSPKRARYGF